MTRKKQRLKFILLSLVVIGVAVALLLNSFKDNLVFFYTPTQWQGKREAKDFDHDRELRIGGLVKEGSVKKKDGQVTFTVTDLNEEIDVTYTGLLPNLFREGQGVVAQGVIDKKGDMTARTILAKHDENYMPKEVYEQLKRSGKWEGQK